MSVDWRASLAASVWIGVTGVLLSSCSNKPVNLVHVTYTYPSFSRLEVFGDRFTAVSPNLKTLRGFTFDGRELWSRSIVGDPLTARYDDTHLLLQEESAVLRLRVTDGAVEKLFDVPEHQQFVADRANGLVYLTDRRFGRNTFTLLDPATRQPIWKREDIEKILHVDQDLVVVATARREYDINRQSYSMGDVAVIGLDRRRGDVRWRVALSHRNPLVHAAAVSGYIVVIDEAETRGLLCIDRTSGRVVGRAAHVTPWGLSYTDVVAYGNQVAFLEHAIESGETSLRFASVPSFEVTRSLKLGTDEPTLSMHGNHFFVSGLHRVVCFDLHTANQLWERPLAAGEWTLAGDRILLSDYRRLTMRARVASVDIASGSERIVLSEWSHVF